MKIWHQSSARGVPKSWDQPPDQFGNFTAQGMRNTVMAYGGNEEGARFD